MRTLAAQLFHHRQKLGKSKCKLHLENKISRVVALMESNNETGTHSFGPYLRNNTPRFVCVFNVCEYISHTVSHKRAERRMLRYGGRSP